MPLTNEEKLLAIAVFRRREFFKRWNQLREENSHDDVLTLAARVLETFVDVSRYVCPPQIRFLSMLAPHYPAELFALSQPPLGLFVQGQVEEARPMMAVVGSRKPTSYSLRLTRDCVRSWVQAGFGIVSGGAMGIDGEAHRACLDFSGHTWAILGGGHHHLHPRMHAALFEKILAKGGALISEYAPHEMARAYYFPERNRLIAALGTGLFLSQAHVKSGSLITARAALDLGKEVLVLKPPLGNENFAGSHELIEAGARPVLGPQDLVSADPDRSLLISPI